MQNVLIFDLGAPGATPAGPTGPGKAGVKMPEGEMTGEAEAGFMQIMKTVIAMKPGQVQQEPAIDKNNLDGIDGQSAGEVTAMIDAGSDPERNTLSLVSSGEIGIAELLAASNAPPADVTPAIDAASQDRPEESLCAAVFAAAGLGPAAMDEGGLGSAAMAQGVPAGQSGVQARVLAQAAEVAQQTDSRYGTIEKLVMQQTAAGSAPNGRTWTAPAEIRIGQSASATEPAALANQSVQSALKSGSEAPTSQAQEGKRQSFGRETGSKEALVALRSWLNNQNAQNGSARNQIQASAFEGFARIDSGSQPAGIDQASGSGSLSDIDGAQAGGFSVEIKPDTAAAALLQQGSVEIGLESERPINEMKTAQSIEDPSRQQAQPSSDLNPDDIVRQVVQRMTLRSAHNQSSMHIQLKPEFLGDIRMQIIAENQHVTIRMTADSNAVKEILEQNIHQLKHELQQHGLQVEKFDVFVEQDNDAWKQGQGQTAFRQGQQRRFRQTGASGSTPEIGSDAAPAVESAGVRAGRGVSRRASDIDCFA